MHSPLRMYEILQTRQSIVVQGLSSRQSHLPVDTVRSFRTTASIEGCDILNYWTTRHRDER